MTTKRGGTMTDSEQKAREQEKQVGQDEQQGEEPKLQKDRLTDLDITDEDGVGVKGGIPHIVND